MWWYGLESCVFAFCLEKVMPRERNQCLLLQATDLGLFTCRMAVVGGDSVKPYALLVLGNMTGGTITCELSVSR